MADVSPTILVVDDHDHNRLMYAEWLREIPGIEVVAVGTGAEALQLAQAQEFVMFLLDINMPDMDGFDLAARLRQMPGGESTPIVFVTAEVTHGHYQMQGYRMGAVDFMVSGATDGEILVQKARVFLQMFRKRQELQQLVDTANRHNADLQQQLETFIRQHDALRRQATHDALTRLPNRALFLDRLGAALGRAARARRGFALAYIDLDGFKTVNDGHGHATGDALLVAAAERLTRSLRSTDTVARLGGDEFALLLESLHGPDDAGPVVRKAHAELVAPFTLRSEARQSDVTVLLGASLGVALYPEHGQDIDELVTLADMTMYAAKRRGGGVLFYPGAGGLPPLRP